MKINSIQFSHPIKKINKSANQSVPLRNAEMKDSFEPSFGQASKTVEKLIKKEGFYHIARKMASGILKPNEDDIKLIKNAVKEKPKWAEYINDQILSQIS